MIDSFGFQTELVDNDERLVRSTFNIKLNGYIVPEILQKDINSLKKFSDKTKIIFSIEASSNDALFIPMVTVVVLLIFTKMVH